MGAESETRTGNGESGRRGIALAWLWDQGDKLLKNKFAMLLLAYLIGNGTGTAISKIMGVGGDAKQDSTLIEIRASVKKLEPVPAMVNDLYLAFQKLKGGQKAMDDVKWEQFQKQQQEERRKLGITSARQPLTKR